MFPAVCINYAVGLLEVFFNGYCVVLWRAVLRACSHLIVVRSFVIHVNE